MKPLALVLTALTLGSLVACSESDSEPSESADTLVVAASFDAAVQVGQNTLVVTVVDTDGAAVVDATVTVDPQMPMMGHGSTEDPVVTNNGDGTYTAFPVTFQMAGAWVVGIQATRGEDLGSLELPVTVP